MSRVAKSGPPPDPTPTHEPGDSRWRRWWWLAAGLGAAALLFLPSVWSAPAPTTVSYSSLIAKVRADEVRTVSIDDAGAVTGTLADGTSFTSQVPTLLDTTPLSTALSSHDVDVTATGGTSPWWVTLVAYVPLMLLFAFFIWASRRAQKSLAGGLGGVGGFGRSKAKVIEAQRPQTRFVDVAGYEGVKQEITEIVDFLRDPGRYAAAGAVGPRGVIMVGPPGTGKTLIARAVAGEASVPFLSVTGSEFVEMFVGVGAARIRDLFRDARDRAPSIIFIDEIDALGSRRGVGTFSSNDEREQTLNQLLAEMDGFDQSSGTVVLAATNRPEALDAALLRPGRFDRQVTVPLPTQQERAAILGVHAAGKHLAPDADLDLVARGTPGFSGADLANLVNEAAINAVRAERTTITGADLGSARDRILLGRRDTSNALLPEERHSVAVHESGHALVAALCEHADPVAKVTILPAGMALGATEQLPEAERHLYSQGYLTDSLAVRLGGRAAELVVLGEGSTGAANDLVAATDLATRMVTEFGLSPALGPVGYGSGEAAYLPGARDRLSRPPYSESTQRVVDREVARLLREAQERAVGLLSRHRVALDRLSLQLMERETVDGSVVLEALSGEESAPGTPEADDLGTRSAEHLPDGSTGGTHDREHGLGRPDAPAALGAARGRVAGPRPSE